MHMKFGGAAYSSGDCLGSSHDRRRSRRGTIAAIPSREFHEMAKYRRAAAAAMQAVDMQAVRTDAGNGRRGRARRDLTSASPAAGVQGLVVLADRFRSLAVP